VVSHIPVNYVIVYLVSGGGGIRGLCVLSAVEAKCVFREQWRKFVWLG